MKIKEIFKDIELHRLLLQYGIFIILFIILLISGGYTIVTKWGSIINNSPEKIISKKMTKIKTQTNYSIDMKVIMCNELSKLYEEKLKLYCDVNNIQITRDQLESDVKYYRLIVTAMNDKCEDIVITRYIHNNDLYRYSNQNDWSNFKINVIKLFKEKGVEILKNYYDNNKMIMPLHIWSKTGDAEIQEIIIRNTNKLLEDLKIESIIYHNEESKDLI